MSRPLPALTRSSRPTLPVVSGFSTSTDAPVARAARACSAWKVVGLATTIPS